MPTEQCQTAMADLAEAKIRTARRLRELIDAQDELHELEAAEPPDTTAIEAQRAKVHQAVANRKAAQEEEDACQERVDDFCGPQE
ncbi:hypothetical protein [Streptomyces sp. NPDC089919]|uniref:hypothetical protein n=1 Tax=Streptomyces sp. NPDC089919 TaxID=3155188 RepID=UPI003429FAD5